MESNSEPEIQNQMPIVGSDGAQIGVVAHVDAGESIKVVRDAQGQDHWIPLDWVDRVDRHVHLARTAREATSEWMDTPPAMSAGTGPTSEASESH